MDPDGAAILLQDLYLSLCFSCITKSGKSRFALSFLPVYSVAGESALNSRRWSTTGWGSPPSSPCSCLTLHCVTACSFSWREGALSQWLGTHLSERREQEKRDLFSCPCSTAVQVITGGRTKTQVSPCPKEHLESNADLLAN